MHHLKDGFYSRWATVQLELSTLNPKKSNYEKSMQLSTHALGPFVVREFVQLKKNKSVAYVLVPCKYSDRVRLHDITATKSGVEIGNSVCEITGERVLKLLDVGHKQIFLFGKKMCEAIETNNLDLLRINGAEDIVFASNLII